MFLARRADDERRVVRRDRPRAAAAEERAAEVLGEALLVVGRHAEGAEDARRGIEVILAERAVPPHEGRRRDLALLDQRRLGERRGARLSRSDASRASNSRSSSRHEASPAIAAATAARVVSSRSFAA